MPHIHSYTAQNKSIPKSYEEISSTDITEQFWKLYLENLMVSYRMVVCVPREDLALNNQILFFWPWVTAEFGLSYMLITDKGQQLNNRAFWLSIDQEHIRLQYTHTEHFTLTQSTEPKSWSPRSRHRIPPSHKTDRKLICLSEAKFPHHQDRMNINSHFHYPTGT